jgi:hypothetical protein
MRLIINRWFKYSTRSEITLTVWNTEVRYGVLKNPTLVPILSQTNLVKTRRFYFFNSHFNIFLPSTARSFKPSDCFRFPHQNSSRVSFFFYLCVCVSHVPSSHHPFFVTWNTNIAVTYYGIILDDPCLFVPLRFRYFPQYPVLQHLQFVNNY